MLDKGIPTPIEHALRNIVTHVPEGSYHAWANPDVRIPPDDVRSYWMRNINLLLTTEGREDMADRCTAGVDSLLHTFNNPPEYYSLNGYSSFETVAFRIREWTRFRESFADVAPFIEQVRTVVHADLRLDFQPEVPEAFDQYLREAGYPDWNPNTFKRHADPQARSLHQWVQNHVQGFDRKPDWLKLVSRLSPDAQGKFSQNPAGIQIPEEDLLPILERTLGEIVDNKGSWSPYDLEKTWKALYKRVTAHYRTEAKRPDIGDLSDDATRPNWVGLLANLSDENRARFRWHHGKEVKYREEADAIAEANEILTQFQPDQWGPNWLDANGFSALRQYWENHFRDENGRIDWRRLLEQLPENLREGFHG